MYSMISAVGYRQLKPRRSHITSVHIDRWIPTEKQSLGSQRKNLDIRTLSSPTDNLDSWISIVESGQLKDRHASIYRQNKWPFYTDRRISTVKSRLFKRYRYISAVPKTLTARHRSYNLEHAVPTVALCTIYQARCVVAVRIAFWLSPWSWSAAPLPWPPPSPPLAGVLARSGRRFSLETARVSRETSRPANDQRQEEARKSDDNVESDSYKRQCQTQLISRSYHRKAEGLR